MGEVKAAGFLSSGTELTRTFLAEKLAMGRAKRPDFSFFTLPRYDEVILYR